MSFSEIITILNRSDMHRIKPGLERMQAACDRLGHPERAVPCVHVAGTNGKGSTIAFLESILRASGYSVGRYTSPHLHDTRERIITNGCMIPEEGFMSVYEEVHRHCADLEPSYFEWLTLLAFVYFRNHPVDVLLLETGMGGRWDATNVATPLVSVITTIDYDHQAYLGDTLAQIAAEKCGILRPDVPAIIALQSPEAMAVIQKTAGELGVRAQIVQPLSPYIPLGLAGDHQRQNAALAVAAARVVIDAVTPSVIPAESSHDIVTPAVGSQLVAGAQEFSALAKTRWPGRLEWISRDPPIICDVAHNVSGMRTVVGYLKSNPPPLCKGRSGGVETLPPPTPPYEGGEICVLLGIMQDKDAAGMVQVLAEITDTFLCVTPNTPRALPAEKLAEIVHAAGKPAHITNIKKVMGTWRGHSLLLITGSFYTVAEARPGPADDLPNPAEFLNPHT